MRSYSLVGTWPACTSRSVPRLIAPNSARTPPPPPPAPPPRSAPRGRAPAPKNKRAWLGPKTLRRVVGGGGARRAPPANGPPAPLLRRKKRKGSGDRSGGGVGRSTVGG